MSQHLARLLTPTLVILSTTSTAFALPRGGFGGGLGGVRAPSVGAERNFSNRFVDVHPTANWDNRVNTIDPDDAQRSLLAVNYAFAHITDVV